MPRMNGAGPMGMGPMTGWGRGYCRAGGYPRGRMGYGYGYRRGLGYPGLREYYPSKEEEKTFLKNKRSYLKARLEELDEMLKNFKDE